MEKFVLGVNFNELDQIMILTKICQDKQMNETYEEREKAERNCRVLSSKSKSKNKKQKQRKKKSEETQELLCCAAKCYVFIGLGRRPKRAKRGQNCETEEEGEEGKEKE